MEDWMLAKLLQEKRSSLAIFAVEITEDQETRYPLQAFTFLAAATWLAAGGTLCHVFAGSFAGDEPTISLSPHPPRVHLFSLGLSWRRPPPRLRRVLRRRRTHQGNGIFLRVARPIQEQVLKICT
ncbi:hypothetical protein SETIT_9G312900v2 [Setaria italica]|uniref:Uncharacterized protein n=1 Tax=Setaria italica TaxID=4555 RepID=A0A368SMP4_SETIT|nr:hypothetical protein SETIT_9G312900v2 [Setaria italica]